MTGTQKELAKKRFGIDVMVRDQYTCRHCGKPGNQRTMVAHPILNRSHFKNSGYVKENGITLCRRTCAKMAEVFFNTGGDDWWDGLHPDDLFKKIGSSQEIAEQADVNFKPDKKRYKKQLRYKPSRPVVEPEPEPEEEKVFPLRFGAI